MPDWRPDIYQYLDFRSFLGDYYQAAKANLPGFSYRYFASLAGFSSPNFLKLVIDGKRNLGPESVAQVAMALQLSAEEHRFFGELVRFGQADGSDEKNLAYQRVSAHKRFSAARVIDGAMLEYLSNWYYPVIRELAAHPGFRADPDWVAKQLVPKIKPKEARAALDTLFSLGLLVKSDSDSGEVGIGDPTLTTGHEIQTLGATNYHHEMLTRASEAIRLVPQDKRDISAMTVCISPDKVAEVKRRLQAFREELMAYCDEDPDPGAVYQINIQVFPMSRVPGDDES